MSSDDEELDQSRVAAANLFFLGEHNIAGVEVLLQALQSIPVKLDDPRLLIFAGSRLDDQSGHGEVGMNDHEDVVLEGDLLEREGKETLLENDAADHLAGAILFLDLAAHVPEVHFPERKRLPKRDVLTCQRGSGGDWRVRGFST